MAESSHSTVEYCSFSFWSMGLTSFTIVPFLFVRFITHFNRISVLFYSLGGSGYASIWLIHSHSWIQGFQQMNWIHSYCTIYTWFSDITHPFIAAQLNCFVHFRVGWIDFCVMNFQHNMNILSRRLHKMCECVQKLDKC